MKPATGLRLSGPSALLAGWTDPAVWIAACALLDSLRQAHGDALAILGLGARECSHSIVAKGRLWQLREYVGAGGGPPLLIVAAPIKHPYVWDLAPEASVVRYCLAQGFQVFLLEWLPAECSTGDAGLGDYAGRALGDVVARVTRRVGGGKPFLMGHSLGGTFAAIRAALAANSLRGLVLLSAPLCFAPGSSPFRDALVSVLPPAIAAIRVVPGSLITHLSACASPDIFIWSRAADAGLSLGDPEAAALLARIERWALDELPLSGALVRDIVEQLYCENRFCEGLLTMSARRLGPGVLRLPTLAVVSAADGIAPPASVRPFIEAMPKGRGEILEHGGEIGVGLQHLAVLVGREAHARIWPQVVAWLRAQA